MRSGRSYRIRSGANTPRWLRKIARGLKMSTRSGGGGGRRAVSRMCPSRSAWTPGGPRFSNRSRNWIRMCGRSGLAGLDRFTLRETPRCQRELQHTPESQHHGSAENGRRGLTRTPTDLERPVGGEVVARGQTPPELDERDPRDHRRKGSHQHRDLLIPFSAERRRRTRQRQQLSLCHRLPSATHRPLQFRLLQFLLCCHLLVVTLTAKVQRSQALKVWQREADLFLLWVSGACGACSPRQTRICTSKWKNRMGSVSGRSSMHGAPRSPRGLERPRSSWDQAGRNRSAVDHHRSCLPPRLVRLVKCYCVRTPQ
mmetsp:Transcript_1059/g.2986  ORF Transcript_1059/g.2986 Transcript_1059/m.2986 type:complete len:313 (+) Transcript_1059:1030-1968(+)